MKVRIVIEAEAPEDLGGLRSMQATIESVNHWALEEFGEAQVRLELLGEDDDD